MSLYEEAVLNARKKFIHLNKSQEKELLRLYKELANQLSNEIANCRTTSQDAYLRKLDEMVQVNITQLNVKLNAMIGANIETSSQIASAVEAVYYQSITKDATLRAIFKSMPINNSRKVVNKLIQGNYYKDGKTLDQRLWNITKKNADDINTLIKINVLKGANARELAKQVDKYINPMKRIDAKTLEAGMSEKIAYQSQRLARTSITHAFSETTIENAKTNPFNKGIKWNLSASHFARMHGKTDMCDDNAGKVFKPNEIPLQHPNCLCYFTEENTDIDQTIKELNAWTKGEKNPKLDKWYKNNKIADSDVNKKNKIIKPNEEKNDKTLENSSIIKDKKLSETVEKFKSLSISNHDNRRTLGRDILDNLNLNDVPVSVRKIDAHGFCAINNSNNSDITEYVLNSADIRNNNYKIKTAFHEAYHAKAKGMTSDYFYNKKEWLQIEETFAESSCHFMVKQLGITEEISPSYPEKLVEMLPRLKQLDKFKDCTTISDFGEIAWTDRLNGVEPTWGNLYDQCMKVNHNWEKYSIQYINYINENVEDLISRMLNNMPQYNNYKEQMIKDCKVAIDDLKNGRSLYGNEKMVMQNVLAITMNRLGVK